MSQKVDSAPPPYPAQAYAGDQSHGQPPQGYYNNQAPGNDYYQGAPVPYQQPGQGYGPPQGQNYGPPQGQYGQPQQPMHYQQGPPPQGMYPPQQQKQGGGGGGLFAGLCAGLACCCCLDCLF